MPADDDQASHDQTEALLTRWRDGDRRALDELLARDLPWLRDHVHRQVGPFVRRGGDTEDVVQDAVIRFLEYGPRFIVSGRRQLRALLARIVVNTVRNQHAWLTAGRRDRRREQPLPTGTSILLDRSADRGPRPSQAAAAEEERAWLQIALELLDPNDRKVILLRDWDERSFAEIGTEFAISEDAARMRYMRALPKLAATLKELRAGHLAALLRAVDRDEDDTSHANP